MTGAWPIIAGRQGVSRLFSPAKPRPEPRRGGPGASPRSIVVATALADRRGVGPDRVSGEEVQQARRHEGAGRVLVSPRAADDLHGGDEGGRGSGLQDQDPAVA